MPPEPSGHDAVRVLAELSALTRAATRALEADDLESVAEIDAKRRRVAVALAPGAGSGPVDERTRAAVAELRALDTELLRTGTRRRDDLGSKLRETHAVGRARDGYAATRSLDASGNGR